MFGPGDLCAPACRIQVDRPQLRIDLRCRDALRLELGRVEHDADFAIDAAAARDGGNALDRAQFLGDVVIDVPAEFFERHVARFGRENGDFAAADVNTLNLRLENAIG